MRGAQRFGVIGAVPELGLDGAGSLDGQRGEGVGEQLPDPLVQAGAGDGLADPAGVGDAVALAQVGGEFAAAALVVADGHPLPAGRSEEHTSELQSRPHLVCRLLLEKKKNRPFCSLLEYKKKKEPTNIT